MQRPMRQVSRRLAAFAIALGVSWVLVAKPSTARAQVARVEIHSFASTTTTDQDFLTGKKDGRPVVLGGELRLPRPGADRLPAVVVVHGSGGVGGFIVDWVTKLNGMGIATFVIDSFTARGIKDTISDQDQLGRLAMITDAYRALELVAKHPRIDPQRIAVMGFSRGGGAALYASMKRFQKMHAPEGASYAAFISFYPSCMRYLQDDDLVDRPVRILHGAADDYNAIAPCREYVSRLKRAGKDIVLLEYANAQHAFDGAAFKAPVYLPQAQTTRHCRVEEVSEGRVVNADSKQPFTFKDPCVERGATIAYDPDAHAQAQTAISQLLTEVLLTK